MYFGQPDDPPVPTICGIRYDTAEAAAGEVAHQWADVDCPKCQALKDKRDYIAIGNSFGWGRGDTASVAKARMRKASSGKVERWVVYRVGPTAMVNGMGGVDHKMDDAKPEQVERNF